MVSMATDMRDCYEMRGNDPDYFMHKRRVWGNVGLKVGTLLSTMQKTK